MGYSSRYHAASLAAVFVALAIGILIGAALGSDIVSGTADKLEEDLGQDLDQLRAENAELSEALQFERDVQALLAPAVTANRLSSQEVALIAIGVSNTQRITADLKAALAPAGAELVVVANVNQPPNTRELVAALGRRSGNGRRDDALEPAAERAGRLLVGRGSGLEDVLDVLVSGFNGDPDGVDAAIVIREEPDGLTEREAREARALEAGLIRGMERAGVRVVGAERGDADESSIDVLSGYGLATVDNIDELTGRVALVLAIDGSEGSFGTKDSADRLLPDLIPPDAGG